VSDSPALHSRWLLLLKIDISSIVDLIWFSGFRGEDLNVIFYQNIPNLHNRHKSAERKICPFQNCVRQPRPPFKMAVVTKNRYFFNCPMLL
jgi:hypothetical protein